MRNLSAPLILFAAGILCTAPASAEHGDGSEAADLAGPAALPGAVQQYCTNIRDAAADARIAWQTGELRAIEEEIERRIADLNERQAEFEEWLQRREAFLAKAQENLVAVYSNMRPDAAASQLSILDAETAASILANLQPRIASAILNEMEPQRAAQLVLAMAGPVEGPEG